MRQRLQHEIRAKFELFEKAKKNDNPTDVKIKKKIQGINEGKTAWSLVYNLDVSIRTVRTIAEENGLTIKFDRKSTNKSRGEDFPFSFTIQKPDEKKISGQMGKNFWIEFDLLVFHVIKLIANL